MATSKQNGNGSFYTGRRVEFETVLSDPRDVMAFQIGALGLKKQVLRTIPSLQKDGSYCYEKYLMSEVEWKSFQNVEDGTILAAGTAKPIFVSSIKGE